MKLWEFNYHLPAELVAQEPCEPRDMSRLLVVHRQSGKLEHRVFREIGEYLEPGDVLVVNSTRVIPGRLFGRRKDTGGKVEVLVIRRAPDGGVEALVRPGKRVRPGVVVEFGSGELEAEVHPGTGPGTRRIFFRSPADVDQVLARYGRLPLPPYIKKTLDNPERYQTVYAKFPGSVAAPTAGLHFTPELIRRIRERGIRVAEIVLHVGPGTFRPVRTEDIEQHRLESEFFTVGEEAAGTINEARMSGGRVVAVGTTVVRTLEAVASEQGVVRAGSGWTDLFIYPGYRFKAIDILVTNFHLPRSTLLMLVCAFAGRELIFQAYREAVEKRYRFYSFGDAMLII